MKKKNFFLKQFQRIKKVLITIHSLMGSFYAGYKIGAFKEPPRDILPKYIQIFCQKMAGSFSVKVVPVEPIPQTHGLWVSNHISWMDIPVVGSVSPIFFIAKSEIAQWPIFGRLVQASGTLFIKRGSGDAGSVSDQIADFLQNGCSVVFFPEATTTRGHKIKRLHGKLLQASMKTQLPIQPVVVCYADQNGNICDDIAYYGDITMKESLLKTLDLNNITAYILALEAINPENKTQDELTEILQIKMQEGLTKLQKRVLKKQPEEAIWD